MLQIFDALRLIWNRIIEPSHLIRDEARRDRLRTFTMIFLIAGLFTTVTGLAYAVRGLVDPTVNLHAVSVSVSSLLLFSAAWMTRRGHLQLPLTLMCLYGAPANFALVVFRNEPTAVHLYDYLALITVVGGLFLTRRLLVLVFLYNVSWMVVTPLLASDIRLEYVLEGPFLFNLMMLAISFVGVALYQRAEKKRSAAIERERIFYKSLFEQSNDAIFLLTLEGRNFAANHRAEALLGYTIAEMSQMEVAGVIVPIEREHSEERRQVMLAGTVLKPYERTFFHKDGTEIAAEVNVALIRDEHGKPLHFQSIVRDIRDRKQQQTERVQLARAEERIGTMRQFVAAVSHDFRTTLAQIEMSSYLARRALGSGLADAAQSKLDDISGGVQRMDEQLHNLSAVSSLMTLSLERCNINDLVHGAIASLKNVFDEKRIRVDLRLDPDLIDLSIDVEKMQNLVRQLLNNAAIHSLKEGQIEVSTRVMGDFVCLSVRDEGVGIEESHLEHLFEPLYRTDFARTTGGGGIGLGLTIVKLVTEAHGGRVEVESAPNQGSIFRILLPVTQP